jgi:hypothetical protein
MQTNTTTDITTFDQVCNLHTNAGQVMNLHTNAAQHNRHHQECASSTISGTDYYWAHLPARGTSTAMVPVSSYHS